MRLLTHYANPPALVVMEYDRPDVITHAATVTDEHTYQPDDPSMPRLLSEAGMLELLNSLQPVKAGSPASKPETYSRPLYFGICR